MRPQLPSEIKSNLTLGWVHTQGADPACYECLPVPHETPCVSNCPVKIGLSGAVTGALSFQCVHVKLSRFYGTCLWRRLLTSIWWAQVTSDVWSLNRSSNSELEFSLEIRWKIEVFGTSRSFLVLICQNIPMYDNHTSLIIISLITCSRQFFFNSTLLKGPKRWNKTDLKSDFQPKSAQLYILYVGSCARSSKS